ncbi:hypothetical protein COL26_09010 [Bacillus thuringiensis]|uniref:Uncharacterized protein n=2 Tax=Bacillus cereus group TaxID=86661 RepID=A0A2B2LQC5_BACCE|nr:hypothetical protein F8510_29025 [Bacillus sp. RM2(2019)]OTW86582.1 hypothetical protein BK710_13595 [Bacillus thuringiensis serovar sumiyoshiensis]OTX03619.1 hypothetical protein BK711_07300 [Bacillus thuringiensis serovar fukuokaensis]OTZ39789.1 hypothetical protein BK762_36060 [Bacillus thuringiensis serovar toumanoffi]PEB10257.1 hypothetical protein COM67_23600 [Bacillus thuringiensis]PEQ87989.1 hypothetical protein CN475_11645 [Bacillus cereus]
MRNNKEAGGNQLLYPALTGSKAPTSKFDECEEVDGRSTARKSPIGSTNNKWGMDTPHLLKFHFSLRGEVCV